MFFDLLSVICLIILIVLLMWFFVEKKKSINRFDEVQKEINSKIDSIQDTFSRNQIDIKDSIANCIRETNEKFEEITITASRNCEELDSKINSIQDAFSRNQIDIKNGIVNYVRNTNENFQEITKTALWNREELDSKIDSIQDAFSRNQINIKDSIANYVRETNENFQKITITAARNREELDNKSDSIQDAFNRNQIEIKDSIVNYVRETNENFQEITIMASKNREEVNKMILDDFEPIKNQISLQSSTIEKIIKDNQQLRKKLDFFTEIGTDSKQLNETEDLDEQENILERALSEINNISVINKRENIEADLSINEDQVNKGGKLLTEINNISVINKKEKIEVDLSINEEQANKGKKLLTEINKNSLSNESAVVKDVFVQDEDQSRAYSTMENTNNNYFITGKAGTGKSFLLKLFEKGTKKKILKVSPTGISALNIGGTTIHSIFGFYNIVNLNVEDINISSIKLKSENKLILKHVDTILIDEISMVRADTFEKMDRILRAVNKSDKLFGGKQILAFGDLFQLPPVANAEEEKYLRKKYGGIYFFFSSAYREGKFTFIELTTNHRQKQDESFFEILNRMREGLVTDEDIALVNKRVIVNEEDLRRVVRIFPKKEEAERTNKLELEKIPARELSYDARIIFDKYNNQNINIENTFPITSTLKLKLGALVMMVVNDVHKRWVNGTLGIISFIKDDVIKIKINDTEYEVKKNVFESREAVYSKGRIDYEVILQIEQYPVVLAYAITIHKSQGMTYQRIACDITKCFAPGQAYVALSRCSSLSGIYLLKAIASTEMSVDSVVKNFYLSAKKF